MSTIGDLLRLYTSKKKTCWVNFLDAIEHRLNHTPHTTTNAIPFELAKKQPGRRPDPDCIPSSPISDATKALENTRKTSDKRKRAHDSTTDVVKLNPDITSVERQFWLQHKETYPKLYELAVQVAAVPSNQTSVERQFWLQHKETYPELYELAVQVAAVPSSQTSVDRQFWLQHKETYPELYELAVQFAAVPSSQTSVERLFSMLHNLLSPQRNQFSGANIENILVLRSNSNLVYNLDLQI
ncbi:hypothetical protein U1Q18_045998 [Sarracenia purpurea var. burkii]